LIYKLRKNGYTSTLVVEPGDLKAKKKLGYYRKRGWQVSARERADLVPKQTTPEAKVLPKKNKKKEKSLIKMLGYWVDI